MKLRDREGNEISRDECEALMQTPGYAVLERNVVCIGESDIQIKTRWMGFDNRHDPPLIFCSTVIGDERRGFVEQLHGTEAEAMAWHRSVVERYEEQRKLLRSGGSRQLSDGVL